ncbi:nucleoside diphosphate kinase regulator [Roseinatronobacter sp. S2]|uniref:nucleoside diphosphate kinase regulator n=1 Tax=Roseinatronobacter sp. S2 TaxID=3035471 RepID=UPI002410243F|nr:nucleoside diphosphate kinase regulator [Roseinatronobacter sp. S2]WFE77222.1 nucleoside diphosphate kinase regulator [Roseinatronobacter sp. S2]
MAPQKLTNPQNRRLRNPKIIIDADDLAHLEALAEGALVRNADLANRLLEELGRAKVLPAAEMPANVVKIGNMVTYRDESSGQERTVMLVYPEDADIAQGKVSIMTPIGVALLGLTEGSSFHWDTRAAQRRTLTVTSVS